MARRRHSSARLPARGLFQSPSLWPRPHCSSWLGAPQLWWDSCTEGPQPTQPTRLEQGERPQIFCSASPRLSEAAGRPPHPQQLLRRGVSTALARDPSACRECWLHTVTEAFAPVPRAANGEHGKAFLQSPPPALPRLRRPCLFWNNDSGLRQSRSEKCMPAPTQAGRQAAKNQITQFRARASC